MLTITKPKTSVDNPPSKTLADQSLWFAIWFMTWPLLINMFVQSISSFGDVWIAGRLGSNSQAALGMGGQIFFLMLLPQIALAAGTTTQISKLWGAKEFVSAQQLVRKSLQLSLFLGVVVAIAGIVGGTWMLQIQGASPLVAACGSDFLKFYLLALIPGYVHYVATGIFRAQGTPRVALWIQVGTVVTLLTSEVVFCLTPFHYGISGIGMAWLIAESFAAALSVVCMRRGEACLARSNQSGGTSVAAGQACLTPTSAGSGASSLRDLFAIGIPASMRELIWFFSGYFVLLALSMLALPASGQASWTIGIRVEEMFAANPLYALAAAATIIVGQNIGAGKIENARRAGWQIAGIGFLLNLIVGAAMFLFAEPLAKLMSSDPAAVTNAKLFFQIVAASEPFVALWYILFGALLGAGYTVMPMIVTAIGLLAIRAPLAWYLSTQTGFGITGTWAAIAVSNVLIGLAAVILFRSNAWTISLGRKSL